MTEDEGKGCTIILIGAIVLMTVTGMFYAWLDWAYPRPTTQETRP